MVKFLVRVRPLHACTSKAASSMRLFLTLPALLAALNLLSGQLFRLQVYLPNGIVLISRGPALFDLANLVKLSQND